MGTANKNILMLGGTGAMGTYLAPLLVDCGYTVFVTSRKARTSDIPGITYLQGDAKQIEFVEGLAKGTRFAALFDFMQYTNEEFDDRVQKLLDLTDQYFYFSSYRVYANASGIIREDSPRKIDEVENGTSTSKDSYGLRKGHQENTLKNTGKTNWTIVRPYKTYAKGRFQFGAVDNFDVIRAQRGLKSAFPANLIDNHTALTYGKDVAKMLMKLVGNPAAFQRAFNVITPQDITWKDAAAAYDKVFGVKCQLVDSAKYREAYKHVDALSDYDWIFSADAMLEATGLTPQDFYSLESGLAEAWSQTNRARFKNGKGGIDMHVAVDELTGSIVDYNKFPEGLRAQYDEASRRIRGDYLHIEAAKPAEASAKGKGADIRKTIKRVKNYRGKKKLVRKGVRSLRNNGVKTTARKTVRFAKKKFLR